MPGQKTVILVPLTATILATASPAIAQDPVRGFYIEGGGGVNFLEDMDGAVREEGDPDEPFSIGFDTGFAVGARAGYGFMSGLRVEGEATYRQNDADDISVGELEGDFIDGDVSSVALMGNVYYDF